MNVIENFLFGYYEYEILENDIARAMDLLLKAGVSAKQRKNGFVVKALDRKPTEEALGTRVTFKRSKMKGVVGQIVNNYKRFGVVIAFLITVLLSLLSSGLVWDVRIDGNDLFDDSVLLEEIGDAGLDVGRRWSKLNFGALENKILAESERIAWVNINRRGSVAYVKVVEKKMSDKDDRSGYANVVAKSDAIIEEISVTRGIARVKIGDSVKAGDLLISGVYPDELGGGFCYAEGIVKGRVSESITGDICRTTTEKQLGKRVFSDFSINIFDFSLNIFNLYRNFDTSCDIIEKSESLSFLGKRLPIGYVSKHFQYYETIDICLTDGEMILRAKEEANKLLYERTSESTLLRLSTHGRFKNDVYSIVTDFVCIEDITKDAPFDYTARD